MLGFSLETPDFQAQESTKTGLKNQPTSLNMRILGKQQLKDEWENNKKLGKQEA